MTLGRPGATSCDLHVEPDAPHVRRNRRRDLRFARRAGDERRIDRIDGDEIAKKVDGRDPRAVASVGVSQSSQSSRESHRESRRVDSTTTVSCAMDLKGMRSRVDYRASSGIGSGVSRRARAGRRGGRARRAARRSARGGGHAHIRAAGGRAESVTMDVTCEADVAALVTRAQQAFGRLDIMICNAGFGYYGAVEEMDSERHAADDGRQLHGDVLRRARRAAGVPPAGAWPSDVRVVDRRQAWHPAS